MTQYLREAELFLSVVGSDCGIANVNIGTSGAEIERCWMREKKQVADVSRDLMPVYTMSSNQYHQLHHVSPPQGIKFDLDCKNNKKAI
jgi:aldehyde dehydrogenase (NAD+)